VFGLIRRSRAKRLTAHLPALLIALVCCGQVKAQTWRWTFENVDARVESSSIAVDKEGNLHLSYYTPDEYGSLHYAFRSAAEGRWYKDTVDSKLGAFTARIALDQNDNPAICYTPRKMMYIHWLGHKWSAPQEVDPGSGLIGYQCSLRYSSANQPRMSWYLESVFNLRFAALEDGAWQARSIEVGTQSGKWNSLVLDQQGFPHLAYSSFKGGELHYAFFDGKDWVRRVLDSSPNDGPRGMGASMVLDARGNPMISYHDLHSLKFVHFDGSKWIKETIEELPPYTDWSWKNFCTTILLDHDGNPHISFESAMLGLRHAWWDGKRWHTQLIRAALGFSIYESSMTMDKDDNLYISFRDPADGALKVAIGKRVATAEPASALKKEGPGN